MLYFWWCTLTKKKLKLPPSPTFTSDRRYQHSSFLSERGIDGVLNWREGVPQFLGWLPWVRKKSAMTVSLKNGNYASLPPILGAAGLLRKGSIKTWDLTTYKSSYPEHRTIHFLMEQEAPSKEHLRRDNDGPKARGSSPQLSRLGKPLGCCKHPRAGWTTTKTWPSLTMLQTLMGRNWGEFISLRKINTMVFTHKWSKEI